MQSFTLTAVSSGVTLRHQDELLPPRAQDTRYREPHRAGQRSEEHLQNRGIQQRQEDLHQERGQLRQEDQNSRTKDNNGVRSRNEEERDEEIRRQQFTPPTGHMDRDRRMAGGSGTNGIVANRPSRSLGHTPPTSLAAAVERAHELASSSNGEALNLGRSDSRGGVSSGGGGPNNSSRHPMGAEGGVNGANRVFKEPRNLQENMMDGGMKDDDIIDPGKPRQQVNQPGSGQDHLRPDLRMDYESPDEGPNGAPGPALVDRSSILEYSRNMEIPRYGKDSLHRDYLPPGGLYDQKAHREDHYQANWSRSRGADSGKRMTTSTADQYCLRWNSYESNILDTFGGLLDSEALSDVTLFCEGESFKSHRLVLAACSTHFSKIFSSSPLNGQLIVILDGTKAEDLHILLQFMYRGVAFLPSDRIESVLRTGEVLQVKGLFNGGGGDSGSRNNRSNSTGGGDRNNWSPPPVDSLKKEVDGGSPSRAGSRGGPDRDNGSPVPSGRIAVQGESPITHNLPIFPQQPYPRPFTSLPSIYPSFPFSRPESTGSKTPSSSVHSFPGAKSGGRSSAVSPPPSITRSDFSKLPLDRDRINLSEFGIKSELGKIRSPPLGHRPASEPYDRSTPRSTGSIGKHPASDANDRLPGSSSPSQSGRGRFDGGEPERQRMKTDGSPARERSFSGDFNDAVNAARDGVGRLNVVSSKSGATRSAADTAEDLRTIDTDERIKRENNQDFLRRLAQVNSERENQLATIQKMDLLRQATAARGDHFLAGTGGFSGPLTSPLTSLPASDLARIAQSVPDPAAIPGEPTSGTGTKLKCPFCERTYGYETNLRAHIRQRHQGIRVPCPYCHRTFTRNNTVRRHIAREHRHHVNPKLIPTKFGQTKVLPDQPYLDTMNALHNSVSGGGGLPPSSSPQP